MTVVDFFRLLFTINTILLLVVFYISSFIILPNEQEELMKNIVKKACSICARSAVKTFLGQGQTRSTYGLIQFLVYIRFHRGHRAYKLALL